MSEEDINQLTREVQRLRVTTQCLQDRTRRLEIDNENLRNQVRRLESDQVASAV